MNNKSSLARFSIRWLYVRVKRNSQQEEEQQELQPALLDLSDALRVTRNFSGLFNFFQGRNLV